MVNRLNMNSRRNYSSILIEIFGKIIKLYFLYRQYLIEHFRLQEQNDRDIGGIVAMDKYVSTDAESLAVSSLFSRASLKTVPDVSWFNSIFLQR